LGLRSLGQTWRNDAIAAFSVALVSLPLALGIALAAGAPPISGLVSAVVGGLLTTFIRGSHIAVNGPGNGLIVVALGAMLSFGGGASAFPHLLGACVVAGALQVLLGVLRMGKVGELIPTAVIQGMLVAIGLIIIGKQAYVLLGTRADPALNPLQTLLSLPSALGSLNPTIAVIGALSLLVLVVHPRLRGKLLHFVPAPLLVIALSVPTLYAIDALLPTLRLTFGAIPGVDAAHRVAVPSSVLGSLVFPSFARIGSPVFWFAVTSLLLVTSIENLVSAKAVEKLDESRRPTNLDRELIGTGLSTVVSAFIGGLPVQTVIARSSVNVNHGARTGWSNVFQGAILLAITLLLGSLIRHIPLSALAAILVYTGYRLAAPRIYREMLARGPDQFFVFIATLICTLWLGLVWGIALGVVFNIFYEAVHTRMSLRSWLAATWNTRVREIQQPELPRLLKVEGIASFVNLNRLSRSFAELPPRGHAIVDFSRALMVDSTTLEFCHEFGRRFRREGGRFELLGLEAHNTFSDHPDASHVLDQRIGRRRLTKRQEQIRAVAKQAGWRFDERRDWTSAMVEQFHFFATHPLEYLDTQVQGELTSVELTSLAKQQTTTRADERRLCFRVADLTFDEGALLPEVYHTTALVLDLPLDLPTFVLEKEELFDRVMEVAGFRDVGFLHFTSYSPRFVIKAPAEQPVAEFFDDDLIRFLEGEETYHIEAQGRQLLIFKYARLATPDELEQLITFSERLAGTLLERNRIKANQDEPTQAAQGDRPSRQQPGFVGPLQPAPSTE
jgi:carbonic anhydrase